VPQLLLYLFRNTGVLRVLAVVWWALEVFGNVLDVQTSVSFPVAIELLIVTLIASAAVWHWQQGSEKCIAYACSMLAIGGFVLLADLNIVSLAGALLIAAAVVQIRTHLGFPRFATVLFDFGSSSAPHATTGSSYTPPPAVHPAAPYSPVQAAATEESRYADNQRPPRYTFADIVGMSETKRRLRAAADDILAGGQDARNGALLFGEPGNGKTLFAEALAGELKVPFFSIAYGDVASKWINETPQNIKAVFQAARRLGHGVLFIDEIDSFLKSRGQDGSSVRSMDQDITNVMLTEIVALRGTKIVLLAATNLREQMDAAGIREGRFDFQIEVPPPDQEAREALLRRGVLQIFEDVDASTLTSLARRWEGFSAARLTALGKQLKEMRRDGTIGENDSVTVELGMQAMRLLQGRRGRLPERVKSIDEIIMPAASRDALKQLAFRLQNLEDLEKINAKIPTGLIFWGPPGTGKTQAAMALAKQSGFAFLPITGAEIMSRPGAWDQLVREARDIRPCLVFLDEADDILRNVRQSHVGTLTKKILTTIDGGAGRAPDVLYVAATNHYDLLDPAVVRGGRFELKVAFDVPQSQDMAIYVNQAILKHSEAGYVFPEDAIDMLCASLQGRSIADADAIIQAVIDHAGIRRLQEGTLDVRAVDVEAAASSVHGVA
jgi:transitional endoplasmic reticulum ATPase